MQALAYTNQIISEDAFQLSDTIYFTTTPADTFFEEYPPITFLNLDLLEPIKPPKGYFYAVIASDVRANLHDKSPKLYTVPTSATLTQYLEAVADVLLYAVEIGKKPILYNAFDSTQLNDKRLLDRLLNDWIATVSGILIFLSKDMTIHYQQSSRNTKQTLYTNELPNHTFLKISYLKDISHKDIFRLYKPVAMRSSSNSNLYDDLFYANLSDDETIYVNLNPIATQTSEFYENLNLTHIPLLNVGGLLKGTKRDFDAAKNTLLKYVALEYSLSVLSSPKITQLTIDENLFPDHEINDKLDDGQGVLIGVLDTQNIQINHPLLMTADGASRLEYIFDEVTNTEIFNPEISSQIPIQEDITTLTMGTSLLLLANGYDNPQSATNYLPKATYIAAKIAPASPGIQRVYGGEYNEHATLIEDVLICFTKLIEYAAKVNKPLVLCLQYGSNICSHDGTSLLERILNQYAGLSGVTIIGTVGAEGDKRHHKRNYTQDISNTSIMITKPHTNIVGIMWTMYPGGVNASLTSRLTGETYSLNEPQIYAVGNGKLYVKGKRISANNGAINVMFRLENFDTGEYIINNDLDHPETGILDFWLAEESLNGSSYLKNSDAFITITSMSNTSNIICVGAYNPATLTITRESGRGYTRAGNILPTCVIDAVDILVPLNKLQSAKLNGPSVALGLMAGEAAGIYSILLKKKVSYLPNTPVMSYWLSANLTQIPTTEYPNERQGYGIYTLQNLKNWLLVNGIINSNEGGFINEF